MASKYDTLWTMLMRAGQVSVVFDTPEQVTTAHSALCRKNKRIQKEWDKMGFGSEWNKQVTRSADKAAPLRVTFKLQDPSTPIAAFTIVEDGNGTHSNSTNSGQT